jgi:hypothetical protein
MKAITFVKISWLLLILTACIGGSPKITAEMTSSMESYADQFDAWFPNADQNVARECSKNPTGVFWNRVLKAYAVTCPLSLEYPNSYGVVTLDEHEMVLNAFSISANSQGEVAITLGTMGWEQ